MSPELILINPWIYDFAAYDLWSKPLGLLYIAGYLKRCGYQVHLIDCLDVYHPGMKSPSQKPFPTRRVYGTGKFWRERTVKPLPFQAIPRTYSRYGISRQLFINELQKIQNPAAILLTSLMTYWYPGLKEAISLAKKIHPGVPVLAGGIYTRLCTEHAQRCLGADRIVTDLDLNNLGSLLDILKEYGVPLSKNEDVKNDLPYPAFDMLSHIDYICIATSIGCPYHCQYCASRYLNPSFIKRDPVHVLDEILYWHKDFGIQDIAFYDDALLVDSRNHVGLILEELIRGKVNIRFHTPNALHVKEISPEMATLLKRSGFRSIRLGLETSNIKEHDDLDHKLSEGDFERAVKNLQKAGFIKKDIGTYILMGLPGQSVESVAETISFVGRVGAVPYLAEYSPIPHTPLWDKACAYSPYDLESEPLFHNNTIFPCWDEEKKEKVPGLKKLAMEIRQSD
ncbi:MAG: radical SAM protein [Deltaproteobacteria bacterium]|nr:radical SAM protein [Deltaproteobacteria bacterium]